MKTRPSNVRFCIGLQARSFVFAALLFLPFTCARAQILTSWYGLVNDGYPGMETPPDPHGAAGPNGIIQTVNCEIAYWDKSGNIIWGPIALAAGGINGPFFTNAAVFPIDTKVLYDPDSARFFVVSLEQPYNDSFADIAVSKNSSPNGRSDWYFFRFETTETINSTVYVADYTALGLDTQAVYATWNMLANNVQLNCLIGILNKGDLINGTAVGFAEKVYTHPPGAGNACTLQPATPVGGSPGNVAFFGETPISMPTAVRVWALSDPLNTHTLSSALVSVPDNGGPITGAPQGGTSATVDTVSPLTQGSAFWYNGSIWFCNTAGGSTGRAIINYYNINLNGFPSGTPTLGESGVIDGGPGFWNYQPAIGGNSQGDVCIVFCQSSLNAFPSIVYTRRRPSDSGFQTPKLLWPSQTYISGSPPCRWGDFAPVAVDPSDGTFWISHEVMNDTVDHMLWSTVWGHIHP